MEETGTGPATPNGAAGSSLRPVLHREMEFRTKLDEFRPRMIQWAREVEKPLGEVGDLRAACAHLRHLLAVANGAALVEELVLYVDYQGARRIIHVPVANRLKSHLKEIQKVAGDERMGMALAQMYLGYVARLAKIAQSQRGGKPVQPQQQARGPKGPGTLQGQQQGARSRSGQPGGQPGGKGRHGRGPRPEGKSGPVAPPPSPVEGEGKTSDAPAVAPVPQEAPAVPVEPAAAAPTQDAGLASPAAESEHKES